MTIQEPSGDSKSADSPTEEPVQTPDPQAPPLFQLKLEPQASDTNDEGSAANTGSSDPITNRSDTGAHARERPASIISRRTSTLKRRHRFLPWLKKEGEKETKDPKDDSETDKHTQYHLQARAYHNQRLSHATSPENVHDKTMSAPTSAPTSGTSSAPDSAPSSVPASVPLFISARPEAGQLPLSTPSSASQSRAESLGVTPAVTPGAVTPNSHSDAFSASNRDSFVRCRTPGASSSGLASPEDTAVLAPGSMGPPLSTRELVPLQLDPNQHVLDAVTKFGNVASNSSGHIACGIMRSFSLTGSKPGSRSGSGPASKVGSPLMTPSIPSTPGAITPGGSSGTPDHLLAIQDVLSRPTRTQSDLNRRIKTENILYSFHDSLEAAFEKCHGGSNPEENKFNKAEFFQQKLEGFATLDVNEKLIADYPVWLLKNVLIQGHLYITPKHVCFLSHLPRRQNANIRTGTLVKAKKRSLREGNRYWCVLKNDSFSYYPDSTDVYFPAGTIDLSEALTAELCDDEGDVTEPESFRIVMPKKSILFKANSYSAAHEWVKALQKEIFRSHNQGDTVRIVIPLDNIVDIEKTKIFECATTIKTLVIESNDTYAIDEYIFTFFKFGDEALKTLIDNGVEVSGSTFAPRHSQLAVSHKHVTESVRDSTLLHASSHSHHHLIFSGHGNPKTHTYDSNTSESATKDDKKEGKRPKLPKFLRRFKDKGGDDEKSGAMALARPFLRSSRSSSRRNSSDHKERPSLSSQKSNSTPGTPGSADSDPMVESSHRSSLGNALRERRRSGSLTPKRSGASTPRTPAASDSSTPAQPSDSIPEIHDDSDSSDDDDDNWGNIGSAEAEDADEDEVDDTTSQKKKSKRFSTFTKVSDLWSGSTTHYSKHHTEQLGEDDDKHLASAEEISESNERFQKRFALGADERLIASYHCHLHRGGIPTYGKLYVSTNYVTFRSFLRTKTLMIVPLKVVENATKDKGFKFGYSGLVLTIQGYEEIFFEFASSSHRDDAEVMLLRQLDIIRPHINDDNKSDDQYMLQSARLCTYEDALKAEANVEMPPVIIDGNLASVLPTLITPKSKMLFTLLTIGSRGDVQPYISLGKALLNEGHRVRIATHSEFKDWIESHGIEFKEVAGDPSELMKIMVDHGVFSVSFLRDAASKFRGWISDLLASSWEACQGSDVLIESPSAMAGIHIAEALQIPYFRAFTMPWSRTRAYPHAFIVPDQKMGGSYNYLTYVMFDNVFWKGISGQVNKWRKKTLGLPRTNLDAMEQNKVPFLYNVSPAVLPPPVDFPDWIKITGYWFLDEGSKDYTPDEELCQFMKKARDDGKKLVYIGFGSIVVSDPAALTKSVVESVLKADVRCILNKGWSDRLGKKDAKEPEIPLPEEVLQITNCPHDWLFPQIDACVHHGGSGTTGAGLRAGLPTIIKPFFGDQFFYANRVEDLGAGIHLRKLNVSQFSKALWEATHNERIIAKAGAVGRQIRAENGVSNAIQAIYRDLDYARSLVQKKRGYTPSTDKDDESWTLVEDIERQMQDEVRKHAL